MWLWFWDMANTAPSLLLLPTREELPGSQIIVFTDDVHSKRESQLSQYQQSREHSERVQFRANKMLKEELKVYTLCDIVVAISDADRKEIIRLDTNKNKVYFVRYVVAPWEIISKSSLSKTRESYHNRSNLIFIGNGGNPTNTLAMRWYLKYIAPELSKSIEGIKLDCIGIMWEKFAENVPNAKKYIRFHGFMSEEVNIYTNIIDI